MFRIQAGGTRLGNNSALADESRVGVRRVLVAACVCLLATADARAERDDAHNTPVSPAGTLARGTEYDARIAEIDALIAELAARNQVEQALIKGLVKATSQFDPEFRDREGRIGLMGVQRDRIVDGQPQRLTNPRENLNVGIAYMRGLLDRYGGNVVKALAAYRVGPDAVDQVDGVPDNEDARTFVWTVLQFRQHFLRQAFALLARPSPVPMQLAAPGANVLSPKEVAHRAQSATVTVLVEQPKRHRVTQGSGFAITSNLIVTNAHVLGTQRKGVLSTAKGICHFDSIVAIDERTDLAVIRVREVVLDPVPLATAGIVEIGDRIYVMGTPTGLQGTFGEGLVSQMRTIGGVSYIQIDAPVSSGSSGSPVMDERGNVVGVVVSSFKAGQNLNVAIAVEHLWTLVNRDLHSQQ